MTTLGILLIVVIWTCSGFLVPLLFAKSTVDNDEAYGA